ncbi:MAG: T9SS type A sorting domain-containing protein [Bacteroidia bacterium]|nr:T9SS type A sorting domain-containing protein [Bacteroidia bacterium]
MLLNKLIPIIKTHTLHSVWVLMLCVNSTLGQNKVGVIKNTQLYNAYPTGIIYTKGKILYSVEGDNIAGGGGSRSVSQLIVYNTNLDTLQTMTLAAGTGTNSDFNTKHNFSNTYTFVSFSYKLGYLSTILCKSTNTLLPDTIGHKAYASKHNRNRLLDLYQLKDSTYVGSSLMQTQILPYPVKFGLWWLNKNLDTVRNVYYDFNLWNSGGCLLRNVFELPKKDLLLGGYTDSLDAFDGLVMRVDSLGAIKFARSIGTDSSDQLNFIKIKNSYYLYGNTKLYNEAGYDFNRLLLIKVDTMGNVIYAKLINNGEGNLTTTTKAINFNNELLWYGTQSSTTINGQRGCLALLMDTNGIVQKYHKAIYNPITNYNTQNPREEFTSAVLDSMKNVYLQYYYYNNNYPGSGVNNFQSGLIKLDSNLVGCIPSVVQSFTTTDVTSLVHSVPVNYTVKRDSLVRVTGNITQTYGINGIVKDCEGYVGINEHVIQNINFKLYPNPSAGMFYYEILEYLYEDYKLEVTNTLGELVLSSILRGDRSGAGSINLSELPNGIYFITLSTPQKQLFTSKLSVVK